MLSKQDIYDLLDKHGIIYAPYAHSAVYTMEEMDALPIPHKELVVKNLFLRDDRKKVYYLVTLPGHKTVSFKMLANRIPSRPLSFASEEKLQELLMLQKGHVTPFGLLNDARQTVVMVFDKSLQGQRVGIHPLENNATVFLALDDLITLLEEHGNPVILCNLDVPLL
ncbi:Prolyl-tRNA editing protein ProX [bioreactor metagenome]|uniref:Prolyl-tRNA editing protein ProX n=1 Tax=bioreactor metagenome TaxID=1076179 RepID=A0A645CS09_9ZZZZ|nr:prolyl-tRNA synthetase associated domain-containing protein [Candidatus Pelethousia sp.]